MKKLLTTLYWGIQVNMVAWILVVAQIGFESVLVVIGFLVAAVLEHLAVKQLGPELKMMQDDPSIGT